MYSNPENFYDLDIDVSFECEECGHENDDTITIETDGYNVEWEYPCQECGVVYRGYTEA